MNAKKPGAVGRPAAPTHGIQDKKNNFGAGNSPQVNKIPTKLSSNIMDDRLSNNLVKKYAI